MYEKHTYPTIKPYRISSKYGMRTHPVTKEKKFHNGVDIACPVGTVLRNTIADGKCVLVGYDDRNGNYCRIEHSNGMLTGYAHLSKVLVKQGDTVALGQDFAMSGNTGTGTGPHLHFRVRMKFAGEWADVDPENYFRF